MSVRVRFAPSPTGHLHIGGARTALYNYLYAKAQEGVFVLRIEDTDQERSLPEYERLQIADLKWLGIDYDEGPGKEGLYGPYRQSERQKIYGEWAEKLMSEGRAYHCFCSEAELEAKKEIAARDARPPHYDGKCRNLSSDEVSARMANGEKSVVRFRAPARSYVLNDEVRGRIVFPEGMVGDFVILRSDGMPVYNFCCVIDDVLMKITHVIRGEDHVSNTVRQLMIYEAMGADVPVFAHVSLLLGEDRQKLSKRHGATAVTHYREQNYLPQALANYLCLLGWSHPDQKEVLDIAEIVSVFSLERFIKAPAIYDIQKLNWMNGQHLRRLPLEVLLANTETLVPDGHPFHSQSHEWKMSYLRIFKEQMEFFCSINDHLPLVFETDTVLTDEVRGILLAETTLKIRDYLTCEFERLSKSGVGFVTENTLNEWFEHTKKNLSIKGKPLFMGMRALLTGKEHGPELKLLIPLTPFEVLKKRLENHVAKTL